MVTVSVIEYPNVLMANRQVRNYKAGDTLIEFLTVAFAVDAYCYVSRSILDNFTL